MREIKFRAWDCVEEKMLYSKQELFDDMLGFRFSHFECDIPIFMQYTGLKDINGKEIYEGDIVKRPRDGYGVVKFHKSWGSFYCATFLAKNEYGELTKATSSVPFWNDANKFEVIGNIYENPEFIGERK